MRHITRQFTLVALINSLVFASVSAYSAPSEACAYTPGSQQQNQQNTWNQNTQNAGYTWDQYGWRDDDRYGRDENEYDRRDDRRDDRSDQRGKNRGRGRDRRHDRDPRGAAAYAQDAVTYTSFQGQQMRMYPWVGRNVVILTPDERLNRRAMARIIDTMDAFYDQYQNLSRYTPRGGSQYANRLAIAVVPQSCDLGCSYAGANGVELMYDAFFALYRSAGTEKRLDPLPALPFDELARNFWPYRESLNYRGSDDENVVATGYSFYLRIRAAEALGVNHLQDRQSYIQLAQRYIENPRQNWYNTLRQGIGVTNGRDDAGRLFTGMMFAFEQEISSWRGENREKISNRFWNEVARMPAARNSQDAVDNFVMAASKAAGADLSPWFIDGWRWPVSQRTQEYLAAQYREVYGDQYGQYLADERGHRRRHDRDGQHDGQHGGQYDAYRRRQNR